MAGRIEGRRRIEGAGEGCGAGNPEGNTEGSHTALLLNSHVRYIILARFFVLTPGHVPGWRIDFSVCCNNGRRRRDPLVA
jgi:hypothetical protein